ncbi:hypothetical protein, partial [Corynebacterium sp. HMSC055G02]
GMRTHFSLLNPRSLQQCLLMVAFTANVRQHCLVIRPQRIALMNWSSTAIAIYVNRALDCTESFTTTAHRHSGLFITHCSSSKSTLVKVNFLPGPMTSSLHWLKNEDDPLHVNYTGKQDPEDDEEEL